MTPPMLAGFFGPLSKEYCVYFYYFAVAGFLLMILFSLLTLMIVVRFYKKMNANILMNLFAMIINSFLLYLSNRLLYTMCVKVL